MAIEIELRDESERESRDHLFDTLDELEDGESLAITATRDIEEFLYRYQIKRNHDLNWEYDRTGPDLWEIQTTKGTPLGERK